LTAEQLEAARAERMRQNGLGTLTLEDTRTWIEETGLCLFLPKRQFTSSVAPSFVEAIGGRRDATPDPRQIAAAEELLVRLELDGVAVRLNLLGQPGEQPDFVVASWVLPYVYALRGDRDWRRNPQLTGSRAVSPLAVQAYKLLEANDSTIAQLKHALGREVSEAAVVRAITELWQQLRIIPVIAAPGQAAKWQLLRHRFQKAIAEGASTSQVTAISVLASIYLQAVIAASMEEVELFLAPLTARSKVREVLRGLVATRQVHTISMGHAPHFYVAGTLPEFAVAPSLYGSFTAGSYYRNGVEPEEPRFSTPTAYPAAYTAPAPVEPVRAVEPPQAPVAPLRPPIQASKPPAARPHFNRPAAHARSRKPVPASRTSQSSNGTRITRRPADSRTAGARATNGARPASQGSRWSQGPHRPAAGKTNGNHAVKNHSNGNHTNGNHSNGIRSNGTAAHTNGKVSNPRNGKSAPSTWSNRNGHAKTSKPTSKAGGVKRSAGIARKDSRTDARAVRGNRKPALTAGAKAGNSKRFGFTARPNKGTKKRG
jgi:23S rRNA pseudouridine2605 synthase